MAPKKSKKKAKDAGGSVGAKAKETNGIAKNPIGDENENPGEDYDDDDDTDFDERIIKGDADANDAVQELNGEVDFERNEDAFRFYLESPKRSKFEDWKNEFGEGEPFLVDGDALIWRCVAGEDPLVPWDEVSGGSSLHVVYLMEKALLAFTERGGKPTLVFFNRHEAMWNGHDSLL